MGCHVLYAGGEGYWFRFGLGLGLGLGGLLLLRDRVEGLMVLLVGEGLEGRRGGWRS